MTTAYDEVLLSLGLAPSGEGRAPRNGAKCGTRGGYERHSRLGEEQCDPCRQANTEYKRERKAAPKDPATMPPINHGTPGGARQHHYRGESACDECRAAYNAWRRPRERSRSRRRRAAQKGPAA